MELDTQAPIGDARPTGALATLLTGLAMMTLVLWQKTLDRVVYQLVERGSRNLADARAAGTANEREVGNVITDNLAMIVFGVVAIVILGGLISGLGQAVIGWVTKTLNV